MALDFDAEYTPASNAADADYPFGSAKNDAVPGDLSGTPLEKEWLNDFLGFHQKLLDFAGITPSGLADTILASDYFDALVKRINKLSEYLVDSGAADAIIVSGDPAYTAYAAGMKVRVKIVATNTGAVTIDVDSLGVKNVKKFVDQAMGAGDLPIGYIAELQYDGTNFVVVYANHGHTAENDGGGLGTLYSALRPYQNLILKSGGTPDEQVDIDADWVILKDINDNPRRIDNPNFTPDNTASGQDGMFGAAVTNDTWYGIWITSGTSGNTSGFSTSGDLATVLAAAPAGYNTYGLLVGWILTDATDDFLNKFYQLGNKARLQTGLWSVTGGVGSRNIAAYVPTGINRIFITTVTNASGSLGIHPVTFTLGDGASFYQAAADGSSNANYGECPIETDQTIFDGRAAANSDVYIQGFEVRI